MVCFTDKKIVYCFYVFVSYFRPIITSMHRIFFTLKDFGLLLRGSMEYLHHAA